MTWLQRTFERVFELGGLARSLPMGLRGLAVILASLVLLPLQPSGATMYWLLLPPVFGLSLLPSAVLFIAIENPLSLQPDAAKLAQQLA